MPSPSQGTFHVATLTAGIICGIILGSNSFSSGGSSVFFKDSFRNVFSRQYLLSTTTDAPQQQNPLPMRNYEPLGIEDQDELWWENFDSTKTLYIAAVDGMENTLLSIASAFRIGYQEKINIKFVFHRGDDKHTMGPAAWNELFSFPGLKPDHTFPDGEASHEKTTACTEMKPLTNWDEVKNTLQWISGKHGSGEYFCFAGSQWEHPPFPDSALWFFKILRPTKEILGYIQDFRKKEAWHGYQWIGVYIRRDEEYTIIKEGLNKELRDELKAKVDTTDINSMIPVENYIEMMKKVVKDWAVHNLTLYQRVMPPKFYVVTDNEDTRQKVMQAFKDSQVVHFDHKAVHSDQEVWNMKAKVIDMFLLASCRVFIGTPFSRFSDVVHMISGKFYLEPDFKYRENDNQTPT